MLSVNHGLVKCGPLWPSGTHTHHRALRAYSEDGWGLMVTDPRRDEPPQVTNKCWVGVGWGGGGRGLYTIDQFETGFFYSFSIRMPYIANVTQVPSRG